MAEDRADGLENSKRKEIKVKAGLLKQWIAAALVVFAGVASADESRSDYADAVKGFSLQTDSTSYAEQSSSTFSLQPDSTSYAEQSSSTFQLQHEATSYAEGEVTFELSPYKFTGLSTTAITYGQSLTNSQISGKAFAGDVEVPGTFAWKNGDHIYPTVADSQKTAYEATFTPDSSNYDPVAMMLKITVKTQEHKDIEEAFGPNAEVEPMTDDDGNVTNYLVTVTNDLTGPVILPEGVTDVVIKLDNHSITGLVGEAGTVGTPGGDGTPAIVVSNEAAQVSIVGPGTVSGGDGGAGNPPGTGAPAVADADGKPVEPAVSGGASVSSGAAGEDLKPAIEAEGAKVTAIVVGAGGVTLTVEVTFKAEITSEAFAIWAEDNLKVKSSDVLTGLDEAVAAKPVSVGAAECVGKTATADLTVEKPSEDAGFYRVVIP